ncbi:MAG: DNA-directed DNA polymerase [Candidatus Woesearchaeota archaeon]
MGAGIMVKIRFHLYDISYKIIDGKPQIHLYGRSLEGQPICVIDESFLPYFYVVPKEGANFSNIRQALEELSLSKGGEEFFVKHVEETKKKILKEEVNAFKVFVNVPAAVPELREVVERAGSATTYEFDIPFVRRYLIDKELTPLAVLEAEVESVTERLTVPCFKASKIIQLSDDVPKKPKILAIDIETYNPQGKMLLPEEHPILMAALYSEDFQKVITWKSFKTNNSSIEFVRSEAELIERLKMELRDQTPDIIVGYFSDGFDWPYLKQRAAKYKIKLDLGLDRSELQITGREVKTAQLTGIVHIDIFKFIRTTAERDAESSSFDLNSIALRFLGKKKEEVDIAELASVWDSANENQKSSQQLERFCEYNLKDAMLTYELCTKFFPNMVELVKLVGLPLFDVTRMSFSQLVEWYAIRQAKHFNSICPNKPDSRTRKIRAASSIKGAFVFEPKPGLYENVVVFDFRSLYPTIISSHNISPETLNCECCEGEGLTVPSEAGDPKKYFCQKRKGFVSTIIEDLITRRARIKEILKSGKADPFLAARSNALKVLANAFYGYLGFAAARWYSIECAESTTAWGRYYIKTVISAAQSNGYTVLYADTDSIFLLLNNKSVEDVMRFAEGINRRLPSLMELELENVYSRVIFVQTKQNEAGAKKKYAAIDGSGRIKIRGFETVRRNTSPISRKTQREVLEYILKENAPEKVISHVKEVIEKLRTNKIPLSDVIIQTQLQQELGRYAAIGPHVMAAQKLRAKGLEAKPGTLISFVIAKGPGRIRDKVRLPDEVSQEDYDGEYYVNNQIIPSVDRILAVLGYSLDGATISQSKQSELSSFLQK